MLPGATQKDSDFIPSLMRQLWVFLAYVAAARLAILLALPPGYASPIWPAAGLAMAATILWGPSLTIAVFLGSIATNLRPDELMQNPMEQILLQSCLALGSSLQAYLGSLIFHQLDRRWPQDSSARRLSLEIILLGPVACITAATIGIAALTAFHVIEGRLFLSNWISWWLGDCFGAGALAPILVRLARNFHPKQIRGKVLPYLMAPAGLSMLLVGALILHFKHNDERSARDLEHSVQDVHESLEAEARLTLRSLRELAEESRTQDANILLDRYATIHKDGVPILWVPRVSQDMRAAFEASLGHAHQAFSILEKTATGHVAPAPSRPVYWPLVIPASHERSLPPPGFNLGSLPEMPDLLQKAWDSGTPQGSPILNLGQHKIILLVQRGIQPEGLFVALLRLDHWLQPALAHVHEPIFHVQIQTDNPASTPAYAQWFGVNAAESKPLQPYGAFQHSLTLGSQTLRMQVDFPASAFHSGRMGNPMLVALLCMILAFTLTVLILSQQNAPTVINPGMNAQQDELRAQYEALRDADRSKAQLLANISHQIRSPLQGILGLLDMLRGTNLDARQRSSIDTVIANCHSMRLMLDDVHTYSSLEAGELTLATDDFLMTDCLRDLSTVYEVAAEERHNTWNMQIHLPEMLRVRSDRRRLHRVLSHLLSDAIRRTQKGRISLHVSLPTPQGLVLIIESQRGPQDEVHDNEWQFGNVKTWQPMEIFNLKVCEHIVQAMGGGLTLERPSPLTSRVTLTLPLPVIEMQGERAPGPEAPLQDILVVDDNAINLTVASGLLTKLGYCVDTAVDGRDALQKTQAKRYDVIFMDCQMPTMDGYEATRQIRAFYKPERGPWIIALSANNFEGAREKALESGMDTWIVKPLSLDILIQTLGYANEKTGLMPSPGTPLMDFKAFSMGLGDDHELIQTAARRYLEEIDGLMERLHSEVERCEAPSVGRTAHSLKGMTSLFAAHALVEAHRNLEMAGKEGRTQEFAVLLKRIDTLTEVLKMELRKILDTKDVA